MCEPEIREMCKNLKTLDYTGYNFGNGPVNTDEDPLAEGTSLFNLYLTIQRFVTLGEGICPADYNTFHIRNFHKVSVLSKNMNRRRKFLCVVVSFSSDKMIFHN